MQVPAAGLAGGRRPPLLSGARGGGRPPGPPRRDRPATVAAQSVGARGQAAERLVDLTELIPRLLDEGRHLLALEGGGGTLGVMLVVGVGHVRRLDRAGEVT